MDLLTVMEVISFSYLNFRYLKKENKFKSRYNTLFLLVKILDIDLLRLNNHL